jgi:hypothetical protein
MVINTTSVDETRENRYNRNQRSAHSQNQFETQQYQKTKSLGNRIQHATYTWYTTSAVDEVNKNKYHNRNQHGGYSQK